jgi:hypothetical protein
MRHGKSKHPVLKSFCITLLIAILAVVTKEVITTDSLDVIKNKDLSMGEKVKIVSTYIAEGVKSDVRTIGSTLNIKIGYSDEELARSAEIEEIVKAAQTVNPDTLPQETEEEKEIWAQNQIALWLRIKWLTIVMKAFIYQQNIFSR